MNRFGRSERGRKISLERFIVPCTVLLPNRSSFFLGGEREGAVLLDDAAPLSDLIDFRIVDVGVKVFCSCLILSFTPSGFEFLLLAVPGGGSLSWEGAFFKTE